MCDATYPALDDGYIPRCTLPAGHTGKHVDETGQPEIGASYEWEEV